MGRSGARQRRGTGAHCLDLSLYRPPWCPERRGARRGAPVAACGTLAGLGGREMDRGIGSGRAYARPTQPAGALDGGGRRVASRVFAEPRDVVRAPRVWYAGEVRTTHNNNRGGSVMPRVHSGLTYPRVRARLKPPLRRAGGSL